MELGQLGALWQPTGMGWDGWERGSRERGSLSLSLSLSLYIYIYIYTHTHIYLWLIHVVWQKSTHKAIILKLKINLKGKEMDLEFKLRLPSQIFS